MWGFPCGWARFSQAFDVLYTTELGYSKIFHGLKFFGASHERWCKTVGSVLRRANPNKEWWFDYKNVDSKTLRTGVTGSWEVRGHLNQWFWVFFWACGKRVAWQTLYRLVKTMVSHAGLSKSGGYINSYCGNFPLWRWRATMGWNGVPNDQTNPSI